MESASVSLSMQRVLEKSKFTRRVLMVVLYH